MSKPWLAENAISLENAKLIIETQFSQLQPVEIEILGEGWDNSAFLINHQYVFRFPRREIAVSLINKEIQLLPLIQAQLPLKIPAPLFLGQANQHYPWPFLGYEFLAGKTADKAKLTYEDRANNTAILANFLRCLHDLPTENLQPFKAEAVDIERLDITKRLQQTNDMLQVIQEKNYFNNVAPFITYLNKLNLPPLTDNFRLIHGDMYAKHLLVDCDKKIIAAIDWGDAHIGHIGLDLAMVHAFLPVQNHAHFLEVYGYIDDVTWEFSFLRALYAAACVLLYSIDVNDKDLAAEAIISFELLLQSELL